MQCTRCTAGNHCIEKHMISSLCYFIYINRTATFELLRSAANMASAGEVVAVSPLDTLISDVRKGVASLPQPDGDGEMEIWSINLVYGELLGHSVEILLGHALRACTTAAGIRGSGLTFVDLGSGEGWPSIVAALTQPAAWARIDGVELVPRLHRVATSHLSAVAAQPHGEPVAAALGLVRYFCDDMLAPAMTARAPVASTADAATCAAAAAAQPSTGSEPAAAAGETAENGTGIGRIRNDSDVAATPPMPPWTAADVLFGEIHRTHNCASYAFWRRGERLRVYLG